MKFLGWDVDNARIVIAACGAVGAVGACYALLKFWAKSSAAGGGGSFSGGGRRRRKDGEVDPELPLVLEEEYGDFREVCREADPQGSKYLEDIPKHYFQFKDNLLSFILDVASKNSQTYRRAIVFGSGTGFLVFKLGSIFQEVKGIERSFSQVVTCYRFQNLNTVSYNFPAEGTLKTVKKGVKSPCITERPVKKTGRNKNKENIEFINAEVDNEHPDHFGEHHVVLVHNCLEDLEDPLEFLALLKGCVEPNGVLIISSTYNWQHTLNQPSNFTVPEVSSSFELLKCILQPHFKFSTAKDIPEVICECSRSSRIQYNHVTAWIRHSEVSNNSAQSYSENAPTSPTKL